MPGAEWHRADREIQVSTERRTKVGLLSFHGLCRQNSLLKM